MSEHAKYVSNVVVYVDDLPQHLFQKRYNHVTSYLSLQLISDGVSFTNNEDKSVSITLQGKRYTVIVKATETIPENTTQMISLDTRFTFERRSEVGNQSDTSAQTSNDKKVIIGGMKKEQIEIIKVLNTFFNDNPDSDQSLIVRSAGMLVHGMAGTGKSTLVNHLINEMKNSGKIQQVISINAWQFSSQVFGENEQKLRNFLDQAKQHAPCVIVMDAIHYLAPNNQNNSLSTTVSVSSNPTHRRLLNTIFSVFDEIKEWNETCSEGKHGKILVAGITNQTSNIDPRIRRAGRLDYSIEFSVPTVHDRTEIIKAIMSSEAYGGAFDDSLAEKIADVTHGFVVSDLKALCNEATLQCIIESKSSTDTNTRSVVPVWRHFQQAQAHIKPSAIREVLVEVPKVKWDDIGGQEEVKQSLREAVEWQFKHADAFKRMNIRPPRGILLYGPPGCSKTLMAKALATEANLNFLAVRGPELFSKWVGESERAVREVFRKARSAAPSIIFFDEIDGLGIERGSSGQLGVGDRVLSQLLNELDGIDPLQGVTVIAATNRPDILDKALLRPGRIDRMLYVSPPDVPSRKEILSIQLKRMSHNLIDPEVQRLAEITDGYSGAEITALAREAAYRALREDIHALQVHYRHFESALETVKPRISRQMIQFYESFANKTTA